MSCNCMPKTCSMLKTEHSAVLLCCNFFDHNHENKQSTTAIKHTRLPKKKKNSSYVQKFSYRKWDNLCLKSNLVMSLKLNTFCSLT